MQKQMDTKAETKEHKPGTVPKLVLLRRFSAYKSRQFTI